MAKAISNAEVRAALRNGGYICESYALSKDTRTYHVFEKGHAGIGEPVGHITKTQFVDLMTDGVIELVQTAYDWNDKQVNYYHQRLCYACKYEDSAWDSYPCNTCIRNREILADRYEECDAE